MIEQLKELDQQLPCAPWSVAPWSKELPKGRKPSYPNRIRNANDDTLLHAQCGDPMTSASLQVAEGICKLRNWLSLLLKATQLTDENSPVNGVWNHTMPERGQRIEAVLGEGRIIEGVYSGQYLACWIIDDEEVGWVTQWRLLPTELPIGDTSQNQLNNSGGPSSEPHSPLVEDE